MRDMIERIILANTYGSTLTITRSELAEKIDEAIQDKETKELNFIRLRRANQIRNIEWWGNNTPINLSFRGCELAGEVGEACNFLKKLERERLGMRGSRTTKEQVAEELADVIICADLTAMDLQVDLGAVICAKFNATSQKYNLGMRL